MLLPHGPLVGAALGGWGYLVAWGALRAVGATGAARPSGLAIGAAFGLLIAFRSSGSSVRADFGEELQQRLGEELWLA